MPQSTPRKNRPFVLAAVAALAALAVVFVIYSSSTSEQMDRSAATAGSSTSRQAPNTPPDLANKAQPPATTGSESNVPPATSPRSK